MTQKKYRVKEDFFPLEFFFIFLVNFGLIAICQALVHQSVIDIENGSCTDDFNLEYLNDALWKAIRFPLDTPVLDPEYNSLSTSRGQILKMKDYILTSLAHFNNQTVIKQIDDILKNGTECDEQIEVFKNSKIIGLKKYLMDSVDYEYKQ